MRIVQDFLRDLYERATTRPESAAGASEPAVPLRVATEADIASGATCRFCMEGEGPGYSQLIAPCDCAGSQEWVHVACLRKWQRTCPSRKHARSCQVCTCRFALSPKAPKVPPVAVGSLLVADAELGSGTFHRTVVLVCRISASGAHGVIINRPALSLPRLFSPDGEFSDAGAAVSDWRRGGPVCGGRLGVLHYTVLHTLPGAASAPQPVRFSPLLGRSAPPPRPLPLEHSIVLSATIATCSVPGDGGVLLTRVASCLSPGDGGSSAAAGASVLPTTSAAGEAVLPATMATSPTGDGGASAAAVDEAGAVAATWQGSVPLFTTDGPAVAATPVSTTAIANTAIAAAIAAAPAFAAAAVATTPTAALAANAHATTTTPASAITAAAFPAAGGVALSIALQGGAPGSWLGTR